MPWNFCQAGGICVCLEYLDVDMPQLVSVPLDEREVQDGRFYRQDPSQEVADFVAAACEVSAGLAR